MPRSSAMARADRNMRPVASVTITPWSRASRIAARILGEMTRSSVKMVPSRSRAMSLMSTMFYLRFHHDDSIVSGEVLAHLDARGREGRPRKAGDSGPLGVGGLYDQASPR